MNKRPAYELPTGLGLTAIAVARGRAAETRRADRLFEDPLAQEFMLAAGPAFAATPVPANPTATSNGSVDFRAAVDAYAAVHTRFFDDYLLDACRNGCRQVVLLGAGLDARAFRLVWPADVVLFELDFADLFSFKEGVLAGAAATPACRRVIVRADLRANWLAALLAAGFQSEEPTAWLLEGLLMYLAEPERNSLLTRVGQRSPSGSQIGLEPPGWTIPSSLAPSLARGVLDRATIDQIARSQAAQSDTSVLDPTSWLAAHGWRARLYDTQNEFAAYGRPVPPAVDALLGETHRWLATAERT